MTGVHVDVFPSALDFGLPVASPRRLGLPNTPRVSGSPSSFGAALCTAPLCVRHRRTSPPSLKALRPDAHTAGINLAIVALAAAHRELRATQGRAAPHPDPGRASAARPGSALALGCCSCRGASAFRRSALDMTALVVTFRRDKTN